MVDPGSATLLATADVVEHLGSDTNIYADVRGLGPLMVRHHGNLSIKADETIGLNLQAGKAHAFGADGMALRQSAINL